MPTDTKEDLRASALRQLNEEWANSIAEGEQLSRVFGRLLEAQQQCHSFGLHTSVVFEAELTQRAWNEFRRMSGDMGTGHDSTVTRTIPFRSCERAGC